MDANRTRILALAEQGEWEEVVELIENHSILAKAQDDFGMLPLHWACTEPSIALNVFKNIVEAFPEACQVENLSGMLPLHVAIKTKLPGLHINILLETYPEATLMKDRQGRYPTELAIESNLPKYTLNLIRRSGAHAMRSSVMLDRATSFNLNSPHFDDEDSMNNEELLKTRSLNTLLSSNESSKYDTKRSSSMSYIDVIDSAQISNQLKDLLSQLQKLSVDIRSSTCTTYRSSFSSSSSSGTQKEQTYSVLWNPGDKLGIVFESMSKDMGARIKRFNTVSNALGIEQLSVGDVLVSINGTPVTGTSYSSITRFIQHAKVACTLCFTKPSTLCIPHSPSMQMEPEESSSESDTILFAKMANLLDTTIKKVSSVEETVRMSSAMSLCV